MFKNEQDPERRARFARCRLAPGFEATVTNNVCVFEGVHPDGYFLKSAPFSVGAPLSLELVEASMQRTHVYETVELPTATQVAAARPFVQGTRWRVMIRDRAALLVYDDAYYMVLFRDVDGPLAERWARGNPLKGMRVGWLAERVIDQPPLAMPLDAVFLRML